MQTLTPVRQPEHESTVDEGWMLRPVSPSNHYTAAVDFALRTLGPGSGRRCLVIGSPLFEAWALQSTGWNVMYLDVRRPPLAAGKQVLGDAIQLPFASQSFDAVSTTCVLCHVGLGRYGDAVESNGDDLALGEIARVMRVKALAAIMFGPSHPGIAVTYVLGSTHRIYSPTQAVRQAIAVDLKPRSLGLWFDGKWMNEAEIAACAKTDLTTLEATEIGKIATLEYSYLAMLLEK